MDKEKEIEKKRSYDFSEFTSSQLSGYFISIRKQGTVGFSKEFIVRHRLQDKRGIRLFWDEGRYALGIVFDDEPKHNNYKLHGYQKQQSFGSPVLSFFREQEIEPDKYRGKYVPEIIEYEGEQMFVIELEEREQDD